MTRLQVIFQMSIIPEITCRTNMILENIIINSIFNQSIQRITKDSTSAMRKGRHSHLRTTNRNQFPNLSTKFTFSCNIPCYKSSLRQTFLFDLYDTYSHQLFSIITFFNLLTSIISL